MGFCMTGGALARSPPPGSAKAAASGGAAAAQHGKDVRAARAIDSSTCICTHLHWMYILHDPGPSPSMHAACAAMNAELSMQIARDAKQHPCTHCSEPYIIQYNSTRKPCLSWAAAKCRKATKMGSARTKTQYHDQSIKFTRQGAAHWQECHTWPIDLTHAMPAHVALGLQRQLSVLRRLTG